ncbi:18955_t:CDS:2 [Funneliformis geosporum]|uniref:9742_t:CDS:1 n=1 Tax=Funneliformis geosporum TaxID=1117311 RepID=A0A9W4SDB7_9GLOM|nr:18955_t:CDS:2 [Funneliformis geosporum]CAI2165069.1 9742_t:CDS:2 [Funneliformis geosporum]
MLLNFYKFIDTTIKALTLRTVKAPAPPPITIRHKRRLPPINDNCLLLTALKTYGNYNTSEKSHHTFTRLAFLGDSILAYNVADHLHEKFPSYSNGKLSLYRSMLVSSNQLSKFACQWGLDKIANVDLTLAKKNNRILGEALEAYIGAYYLDCCRVHGQSGAHMKKLHQAAIKVIIKEIKAANDVNDAQDTKKTKSKKEKLIPEVANNQSNQAVTLKAETSISKTDAISKQQKICETPVASKNTQEHSQQQLKAIKKANKKQPESETKNTPTFNVKNKQTIKNLSQDLVAKNISKEIESKHQMLKEIKRRKKQQEELRKLSIKQLLTRLKRLV